MSGPVVGFQVRNRRGLGHQMRVANIATALRQRHPDIETRFHLACEPPDASWDPTWRTTFDCQQNWAEWVAGQRPDVVVYDTVLPADPLAGAAATTRFVYIRRHVQAERGAELDRHPFLEYVERIIIPHALDEAVGALASHLARKAEWVGPIARQPKPASPFPRGVDDTFQLTSTAGGGGFGASTDRFFDLVEQVGRSLGTSIKGLAHLVVLGPNYDNPARAARLGAVAGVTVRQHDSALVDRLAEADLVLAEGGYNTVNEICLAGAAAVFVPAPRGFDDQHQRVAALAHRGVGLVVEPDETLTGAVQRIISLATDPQRLAAMRAAHVPIALGNDRAADLIADVARRR